MSCGGEAASPPPSTSPPPPPAAATLSPCLAGGRGVLPLLAGAGLREPPGWTLGEAGAAGTGTSCFPPPGWALLLSLGLAKGEGVPKSSFFLSERHQEGALEREGAGVPLAVGLSLQLHSLLCGEGAL